jgi:hypothetical protein
MVELDAGEKKLRGFRRQNNEPERRIYKVAHRGRMMAVNILA